MGNEAWNQGARASRPYRSDITAETAVPPAQNTVMTSTGQSCRDCGEPIEFRYVDGRVVPIHVAGFCSAVPRNCVEEDDCFRTTCPRCERDVFFVRHNGGCVWLDELGLPWPEHQCYKASGVRGALPSFFESIPATANLRLGVVTEVKYRYEIDTSVVSIQLKESSRQSSRIHAAFRGRCYPGGLVAYVPESQKVFCNSEGEFLGLWQACRYCQTCYPPHELARHESRHSD